MKKIVNEVLYALFVNLMFLIFLWMLFSPYKSLREWFLTF